MSPDMKHRSVIPAALLLGLALVGCSAGDDTDDAAAGPEVTTCTAFFEGTGTPLAQRAEDGRAALAAGEVGDPADYGEINGLDQRLAELAADAPDDLATLVDDVAVPFDEAVDIVNDAHYADEDEEEAELPDLTDVDVATSESAQDELTTACDDAGYEPAED